MFVQRQTAGQLLGWRLSDYHQMCGRSQKLKQAHLSKQYLQAVGRVSKIYPHGTTIRHSRLNVGI